MNRLVAEFTIDDLGEIRGRLSSDQGNPINEEGRGAADAQAHAVIEIIPDLFCIATLNHALLEGIEV